jgi:hypothetical protein
MILRSNLGNEQPGEFVFESICRRHGAHYQIAAIDDGWRRIVFALWRASALIADADASS